MKLGLFSARWLCLWGNVRENKGTGGSWGNIPTSVCHHIPHGMTSNFIYSSLLVVRDS
jgi:hypothetical protein